MDDVGGRVSAPEVARQEGAAASVRSDESAVGPWLPIESAPKDGRRFLVYQSGEVYQARYDEDGRIMWRTHTRREPQSFQYADVEIDGVTATRMVLIDSGPDVFEHHWCLWTRLFDFAPTHWMPLTSPKGTTAHQEHATPASSSTPSVTAGLSPPLPSPSVPRP